MKGETMDKTNQTILLTNLMKELVMKIDKAPINRLVLTMNKSKQLNNILIREVINKSDKKEKIIALMDELNCVIKTIHLDWNGKLKESVSLKTFKYTDIVQQSWEESDLYSYLKDIIFIFVVLKSSGDETYLQDIKVWKMPTKILDENVKSVWLKTQNLISVGNIVMFIDSRGRYNTYFPSKKDTKYVHIRPHAQSSKDCYELPVPDKVTGLKKFTKHSFWLNNNFIQKIIIEDKYYD
ncbi:MAG: hypothetical protein NC133_02650 [Prevotella sp.]|nr:hypothetical protein [Prevotella sp.]